MRRRIEAPPGKRWYDVTVIIEYHDTYKVLATSDAEAREIVDDALVREDINPESNTESYSRTLFSELGCDPYEGEETLEKEED